MQVFEYEISTHAADDFKEMVYFCTPEGTCSFEKIPSHQIRKFETFLNERGQHGWELVQMSFGKDGILAFWKRMIRDSGMLQGRNIIAGK